MSHPTETRRLAGAGLAAALRDSRATTLARVADLDDEAWLPPPRPGVNPIAWELGHLAWFAEFWILRGPHRPGDNGLVDAARPPRFSGSDALFDSARLAHADRWHHAWPSRDALFATLAAQLEACIATIPERDGDDAALYFHRLALFHEDMHGEALAWLRAALGHAAPVGLALESVPRAAAIGVRGGSVTVGRHRHGDGFAFDNELDAHSPRLDDFEIDAVPVDNGAFLDFVEAGGYAEPAFWTGAASTWRAANDAAHPAHWRHRSGAWEERWFDRWLPLDPRRPVVHVNAFEAEAWCRRAGRRLPRAAEWEHAAQSSSAMHWGRGIWEWTADPFLPYPGFIPGPYRDYSLPWFGDHRELRGGSFAAHDRMLDPSYRNFFTPDRSDVFAGFRSAASIP
ncbi:MAG: selenoneine synthase SenA [Caldimonas sp.]